MLIICCCKYRGTKSLVHTVSLSGSVYKQYAVSGQLLVAGMVSLKSMPMQVICFSVLGKRATDY